jgi:hypothetical protein
MRPYYHNSRESKISLAFEKKKNPNEIYIHDSNKNKNIVWLDSSDKGNSTSCLIYTNYHFIFIFNYFGKYT